MSFRILLRSSCLGLTLIFQALASPAAAQTQPSAYHYDLQPTSSFENGCFGPCECPVQIRALKGTFDLQQTSVDPLFTYYRVFNVAWAIGQDGASNIPIQGSGTYRVGGEFAVQQELTLDLSINGAAPVRFDSGLVTGGGQFPGQIVVDISRHQNTACIDTVLHVDAVDPVVTAVGGGGDVPRSAMAQAAPNPFHVQTEIRFRLPHAGDLEVTIYDIRGRIVRHLAQGGWVSAGVHGVPWDGRRDDRSLCASGVYFARASIGTDRVVQRIVKVD